MEPTGNPAAGDNGHGLPEAQLEQLSEQICQEFGERVPREQIHDLVAEVAVQFEDATVTTFVPLLIHRQVAKTLKGSGDIVTHEPHFQDRAEDVTQPKADAVEVVNPGSM